MTDNHAGFCLTHQPRGDAEWGQPIFEHSLYGWLSVLPYFISHSTLCWAGALQFWVAFGLLMVIQTSISVLTNSHKIIGVGICQPLTLLSFIMNNFSGLWMPFCVEMAATQHSFELHQNNIMVWP